MNDKLLIIREQLKMGYTLSFVEAALLQQAIDRVTQPADAKPEENQKPDFHVRPLDAEHGKLWVECGADHHQARHFYTRPAPPVNIEGGLTLPGYRSDDMNNVYSPNAFSWNVAIDECTSHLEKLGLSVRHVSTYMAPLVECPGPGVGLSRLEPSLWQLVPVEPTQRMLMADGCNEHHCSGVCSHHENRRRIWSAMLTAAREVAE